MNAYIGRIIRIFFLSAAATSTLWAQSAEESAARTKVIALEHAWNQTEESGDLSALDAIFDNGLVYVDSDGTLMTKAEFLARVKSAHPKQVITQSMSVQIFGETAIATGTYQASFLKNGKSLTTRGRFVDTWVRRAGTWVCVAAQSTPTQR